MNIIESYHTCDRYQAAHQYYHEHKNIDVKLCPTRHLGKTSSNTSICHQSTPLYTKFNNNIKLIYASIHQFIHQYFYILSIYTSLSSNHTFHRFSYILLKLKPSITCKVHSFSRLNLYLKT